MTPAAKLDALALTGRALYGPRWQSALAADLRVSDRTVRRWIAKDCEVPRGVIPDLRGLLAARGADIREALDALPDS